MHIRTYGRLTTARSANITTKRMKPQTLTRGIFTVAIIFILITVATSKCPHSKGGPNYPFYTTGIIINASTNAVNSNETVSNRTDSQPVNETSSPSSGTAGPDETQHKNISGSLFFTCNCTCKWHYNQDPTSAETS